MITFNHLRYRRLRNNFNVLYKQLTTPLPLLDSTQEERKLVYFAKDLLLLELYFTRSSISDVTKGIVHGVNLIKSRRLAPIEQSEVFSIVSILYQQRATIHFNKGHLRKAKSDQQVAYKYYLAARSQDSDDFPRNADPHHLSRFLRAHTVQWKYDKIYHNSSLLNFCFERVADLDPFYATSHYSYLIDFILLGYDSPSTLLEAIYGKTTMILETEGYGTNIDQAKLITLRRRWWVLHFILENNPNYDLLRADIEFGKQVSMFNEIRELDSYIRRISCNTKVTE